MSSSHCNGTQSATEKTSYSFYLNLVVLENLKPSTSSIREHEDEKEEVKTEATELVQEETKEDSTTIEVADDTLVAEEELEGKEENIIVEEEEGGGEKQSRPSISSLFGSPDKKWHPKNIKGLDKSLHNGFKALSKRSLKVGTAVGSKAKDLYNSKTMVNRTSTALVKSIPEIVERIGLDISVAKRFRQGTVFVLQVDLKPTEMKNYVEKTRGVDAAENYEKAMSTLRLLDATDTMMTLEKEMMPIVRHGLMDKLSDLLLATIKEKENGLELECIALEEGEEARWLFTYMEFQSQMAK